MASVNAIPFPVFAQAYRLPVAFRDTSGNLITSWTGGVATVYPDNGAGVVVTMAESPAGSGVGFIDIPAAQMSCSMATVVATITNANMTAYVAAIQTLNLSQFSGRYDAQSIVLFERMLMDMYSGVGLNGASQIGGAMTVANPDGSTHLSATVTENSTGAIRSKMI